MKIAIASDQIGFETKKELVRYFNLKKYEVKDLNPEMLEKNKSYVKQGKKIAKYILKNDDTLGIGICEVGLGMSFVVNRFKGIRGAKINSILDAKMAKMHNNANILIFGSKITNIKKIVDMFNAFIKEQFEGGRHIKRLSELDI